MKTADLAEAFGDEIADDGAELDEEAPESGADEDAAVQADADVFFDSSEDSSTRLEALRRLVRKLK